MARKSTVDKLPDDQFDFVITAILNGLTDREISSAFQSTFEIALPKSSLNTWRNKAGNELAERYRLRRYQVRTFVETLKAEGVDVSDDKYARTIENVEDQLLTNERKLLAADPVKLLGIRQEDERLKIKREQIDLNREKLVLERQKLLGMATNPVKQGTEFMTELFDYLKDDADGVRFLKQHTRPFIDFLEAKYAEGE